MFSAALGLLVAHFLAGAVDRSRPFVSHHAVHLFIAHAKDPGFPSDHATGGFAIAMAVWLYDRTFGALLFALAGLLSFARVYAGTHYPGDVLAGAAIGAAAALVLHLPPLRPIVEWIADRCSELWDRILGGVAVRRPSP